ncbi:hypothetical protein RIF29_09812 [Crotalaria pallida]|uniref:Uncharacterized protein n=1 Tax=Crotalaria pallida TaxID=3830 RepID=A0AAN9FS69_CROPI
MVGDRADRRDSQICWVLLEGVRFESGRLLWLRMVVVASRPLRADVANVICKLQQQHDAVMWSKCSQGRVIYNRF